MLSSLEAGHIMDNLRAKIKEFNNTNVGNRDRDVRTLQVDNGSMCMIHMWDTFDGGITAYVFVAPYYEQVIQGIGHVLDDSNPSTFWNSLEGQFHHRFSAAIV